MNRGIRQVFLVAALLLLSKPQAAQAQYKAEMAEVYAGFKTLQQYIYDDQQFSSPEAEAELQRAFKLLSRGFHRVDDSSTTRMPQSPGFESMVRRVSRMIDDAGQRFNEGKKDYSAWRLRKVANSCITCHAIYRTDVTFATGDKAPDKLSAYGKGSFYFATRQFDRAEKELELSVRQAGESGFRAFDALRKWLVIQVRVRGAPEETSKKLAALVKGVDLARVESEEVQSWQASLERWKDEAPFSGSKLDRSEKLLGIGSGLESRAGDRYEVEKLRATALLHQFLAEAQPDAQKRARAIFLLGVGYRGLGDFFDDEMAEIFLVQCIDEFPGTASAKQAFQALKEIIEQRYSGSKGTEIPDDEQAYLSELQSRAQGDPRFEGRL